MFSRRFRFRKRHRGARGYGSQKDHCPRHGERGCETTLADVPQGCTAKVLGFSQYMPPERLGHLQALGLIPGHKVRVVQHSPVTVVQIEHTELALERELAREIQIVDIEE